MKTKKPKEKKYDFKYLIELGYDPYENSEGYYYDHEAGDKVIRFFKNEIRFTKGKWKGKLFKPEAWQEEILRCLFGWKCNDTGLRRYRTMFFYIPRKNGKSQLAAAIAVYCLFVDKENDAEIYIGARDRGQALTLYHMSESMIEQNQPYRSQILPSKTTKTIQALWDDSKIQAISGDALSAHSLSPSVGIIDELHAQHNGDLLSAIQTGMGGREQPLLIMITTADFDRESICNDELDYAIAIRDKKFKDPTHLPIIYQTEKDADWESEKVWKKANPLYPISPDKTFMEGMALKAKHNLRIQSDFKRYNLNMTTQSLEGWLNMDAWRIGNEIFDEEEMEGEDCYLAFDLASKKDLCSKILFFPKTKRFICRHYCPKKAVEEDKSGYYQEWIDDGELIISGDKITDYRVIKRDIEEDDKKYNILKIGFDPHNANTLINDLLDLFGGRIEEDENFMVEFAQTYRNYCDPAKEFEAMVIDGTLKHNSRVLDWMAANVTVREGPSGDIMPQKPKAKSPLKIDGIAAGIMAIGLWLTDKEEEEETGEIVVHNLEDYLEDDNE